MKTKKITALILAFAMIFALLPTSVFAEETVTLNVSQGNIVITPTGYKQNSATETAHTGAYIITGTATSADRAIVFENTTDNPATYNVTFKDLVIKAKNNSSATNVVSNADDTIKITNIGDNLIKGGNHPAFQVDGEVKPKPKIDITLSEGSFLTLDSNLPDRKACAPEITCTVDGDVIPYNQKYETPREFSEIAYTVNDFMVGDSFAQLSGDNITNQYTSVNYKWYSVAEDGTETEVTGVCNAAGTYRLKASVSTKQPHTWANEVSATVNGKSATVKKENDIVTFSYDFQIVAPKYINKVEVTIPVPKAGEPQQQATIITPNVSLVTDYSGWDPISSDGNFAANEEYKYSLDLIPDNGYLFTDDAVLVVNGEEVDARTYSDYIWYNFYAHTYEESHIIKEINLSIETPKAGEPQQQATIITPNVSLDTNYGWVPISSDGNFAENKIYAYEFVLKPADGYIFAEDAVVKINGEEAIIDERYSDEIYGYYFFDTITDESKLIKNVNLSVTAPVDGKAPSAPIIKTPNVEFFTDDGPLPEGYRWLDSDRYLVTKFEKGEKYRLFMYISSKDGYILSTGADVKLNGIAPVYSEPGINVMYLIFEFTAKPKSSYTPTAPTTPDEEIDQGITDDPTIDTVLPDGTVVPGKKPPVIDVVDPGAGGTKNPATGDSIFANLF